MLNPELLSTEKYPICNKVLFTKAQNNKLTNIKKNTVSIQWLWINVPQPLKFI